MILIAFITNDLRMQCPMDKKLIDLDLLTHSEREWLNAYHAEVLQKLSPRLGHDLRALRWLKQQCSPL